jgi:predicted metal-dependent hydrolase
MANHYLVNIDGQKIPFKIIEERRSGARVSLASDHVILRVPKVFLFGSQVQKHLDWAVKWIRDLKMAKPHILDKYTKVKVYHDGDTFVIGSHSFRLEIIKTNTATGSIKYLSENLLRLSIPHSEDYDQQKLIKKLLIKFFQKFFQRKIAERVKYFNDLYFQKPINSIKLKYNKSNWGSCSSGSNLNFSVRLFFAPDDVIDYVVIHELSHLIEMNHSDRFWKIVEKIMPNYQNAEKILKLKSGDYDF